LKNIEKFLELLDNLYVRILPDNASPHEIVKTMERYGLASRDAFIALTCKHYGIGIILTFDEDFKRAPWLKTVP